MDSSKNTSIRHQSELVQLFGQLVREEKDIPWALDPDASDGAPVALSLNVDGRRLQFRPRFALAPTADDAIRLTADEKEQTLFVVPRLSAAFLDVCRKYRVSVVDLNGTRSWTAGPDARGAFRSRARRHRRR